MKTIAVLWTIGWLVCAAAVDIRRMIIPDRCVLAILLAAPFFTGPTALCRLAAAAAAILLIPCMGMGDVKLFAALGLCTGSAVFKIAAAAMLWGGIYAFAMLTLGKANKKDRFAFGPFIAAAAAIFIIQDYFASTSAMCAISLSMLQV